MLIILKLTKIKNINAIQHFYLNWMKRKTLKSWQVQISIKVFYIWEEIKELNHQYLNLMHTIYMYHCFGINIILLEF